MLSILTFILQIAYGFCVAGLALYGGQALWLTYQRLQSDRNGQPGSPPVIGPWPHVTLQLPIYNERHVAERLIDACAQQQYPRDRLQLHVLDDSDDQTAAEVERCVLKWQRQGIDARVIRRADRAGYKAGALAHALPLAQGEFIALFDADFVPEPDFLQQTIPYFLAGEERRIGFVQARWAHLNDLYSPLTRCQGLALDGHFVVEQAGRQSAGYAFGFNGSAGLWRRACIEDTAVGGWQDDTLCEDLDLSYRAQLAGWKPLYLDHVAAPAEVPPQLVAFKRQQFRWAKGSVQTLRKLAHAVWHSPWPAGKRLAAFCHLGSYLIHPLLLLLLLVMLPLTLLDINPAAPLAYLGLVSVGPPLLYALAQRRLHPHTWFSRWAYLPLLMLLGTGLCLNNSWAIWQAITGKGGQFLRTPKFRVEQASDRWQTSAYRLPVDRLLLGELALAVYAAATGVLAAIHHEWWTAPFALLYAASFGLMVGIQLWQSRPSRHHAQRSAPSQSNQPIGPNPTP